MFSVNREYITSERFIHDALLRQAEAMVRHAREVWAANKLFPLFAAWPSRPLRDVNGRSHEDIVLSALFPSPKERKAQVQNLARQTKAYGLFVIEPEEERICAFFETKHGSRVWTVPIFWTGDRKKLGETERVDNQPALGLLWTPN